MKTRTILKLMLILVFLVDVFGFGYYFLFYHHYRAGDSSTDNAFGWKFPIVKFPLTGIVGGELAYSSIRDPGGVPQGLPIRLRIPSIGVDSAIEDALITPDGRMDVPFGSVNVAWFSLGPHPGQEGSAVIGGHFGIRNGVPFVFYRLDNLRIGNKVYIIDDKGDTITFVVRSIGLFKRNDDATTVFTSNDGLAHLNLITCEGVWNQINDTYPERRVVFTDVVTTESAVPAVPVVSVAPVVTTFFRSLSLGAQGADVVTLQNALEKKGFLVMPRGIVKGYFGALTRTAVAEYQASVNLPQNGIFNSLTRAKLIPEPSKVAIKPALPTTAVTMSQVTPQTLSFYQVTRQYIKILFFPFINGLITSLLLVLIVFLSFEIVIRKR